MARPRLLLATLTVLVALTASSASAATCPANQTFSGYLTPGNHVSIPVTTPVRGDTTFQFIPKLCVNSFTMSLGNNYMTGECSLAIGFTQLDAGTYTVQLTGSFAGMEGMAAMPFQLKVYQTDCL